MRKILCLVGTLLCIACVFGIRFTKDRVAPSIKVSNSSPSIACNVTFDDLLRGAESNDSDLKDFFIEERDFYTIVEKRRMTYVAIDNSGNVSKETVYVNIDPAITSYHIEPKQELVMELKHDFLPNDYFAVRNGCGWEYQDSFTVDGLKTNEVGEYDVYVTSLKHKTEPFENIFEVVDLVSPVIYLSAETLELEPGLTFSPNWIMRQVVGIEDDLDEEDYLLEKITYETTLPIGEPVGNGTYQVVYSVRDYDGNIGKATLKIKVSEAYRVVVQESGE